MKNVLVFMAVVVVLSLSIAVIASKVAESSGKSPPAPPAPSSVIDQYSFGIAGGYTANVTEFRDHAGRICVMVQKQFGDPVLDCGYPRDFNREQPE